MRLLLMCALVVPGLWYFLLGWDGTSLLGGHDSYSFILQYRDFVRVGADWHPLLYAAEPYGGSGLHNALPIVLFYQLWAWLGVTPVLAYNLSGFGLQILVAFLGVRATQSLASSWRNADLHWPLLIELGAIILFAFAPYLGWRFGHGHQGLIFGVLVFYGAAGLVTAARADQLSFTLLTMSLLAWVTGLSSPGQQIGFYSVLFGGPIALALLAPRAQGGARRVAVTGLVAASSAALALPRLLPMLGYATGPDAARSLSESRSTYSYFTANALDWIHSIPWGVSFFPTGRPYFLLHETNYAFGPLLLLLLIVPWKRSRAGVITALISAAFIVALSTNFTPISDWMIALVPPLASFRVPGRAMVVLAAFLPMVTIASVMLASATPAANGRPQTRPTVPAIVSILAGLALFAFDAHSREQIVWVLTLGVVALYWATRKRPERTTHWLPYTRWLVFPLAIASLLAFQQRLAPFATQQAVETLPKLMRADFTKRAPELEQPLTRAVLNLQLEGFFGNTGWAADIATVNGYWVPPRRFQQLEAASRRATFDPHLAQFGVGPKHPGFEVLRHLYNICCVVREGERGIEISRLDAPMGPAWFSESASRTPSFQSLIEQLESSPTLDQALRRTLWLVDDPDSPPATVLDEISGDCASSTILAVGPPAELGELARIRYQSIGRCPVTASTNYLSQLSAWLERGDGETQPVDLFPSYGSLVGAIVPEGEATLVIAAVAPRPWWRWLLYLTGLALFAFACALGLRASRLVQP